MAKISQLQMMSVFILTSLFSSAGHSEDLPFRSNPGLYSSGSFLLNCFDGLECKLDLGVNITSLSQDAYAQLKNQKEIGKVKYASATGAVEDCSILEDQKIELGNSGFQSQVINPVYCPISPSKITLIGLDVFKEQSIYIDNQSHTLTIGYQLQSEKSLKPFRTSEVGHIILPVHFNRGKINVDAFFDTGAAFSLLDVELIMQNPEVFSVISSQETGMNDSFGNPIKTLRTIANTYLENVVFVAPYLQGVDFRGIQNFMGPKTQALIGFNLIVSKNWYFDFKNKTWFVE